MVKADVDKMYFANNERKLHGIPMHRKKSSRKRFYTRCEASETIDEFLRNCNGDGWIGCNGGD